MELKTQVLPAESLPVHDKFVQRRVRLKDLPPSRERHERYFFYEIDYHTRPGNVVDAPCLPPEVGKARARMVTNLTGFLADRVYQRAVAYEKHDKEEKRGEFPPRLPAYSDRDVVVKVSTLLREIISRYFWKNAGIDFDALDQAMERYANGELRSFEPSRYSDYEPDSGYHFTWGELAFLAIEMDVDKDLWTRFLNVCIRSQEIYVRAYPPSLARRDQRTLATKFRPIDFNGPLSPPVVSAIRERYQALKEIRELEEASCANAYFAVVAGMQPPQR